MHGCSNTTGCMREKNQIREGKKKKKNENDRERERERERII